MKKCFNCNSISDAEIYGISICNLCKSDLRLFTDETISRQKMEYQSSEKYASYQDEIAGRLLILERDYLKKRIKLLYVLDRLDNL